MTEIQKWKRPILELNRALAAQLGLDGRYTISTNVAHMLARTLGVKPKTAKFLFHACLAAALGLQLHASGQRRSIPSASALLALLFLEGFDH